MSNLPAEMNSGGAVMDAEAFAAQFAAEASKVDGGEGKAFLKLDGNTGEYTYGAQDEELEPGSRMLLNYQSYKRGFVCWKDEKVVEEVMVPLLEPAVKKHQLEDHGPYAEGDGWVEQYTIEIRMLDEPFVEMIFQANNASKRRAMGALMKEFAKTFQRHPGLYPVIELDVVSFEAKIPNSNRKTTKYAPKLRIVEWLSEEELEEIFGGAQQEEDDDDRGERRSSRRDDRDEETDRPARRSRRDEDDDQDEPKSSRRSSRDDEDDDQDDEPKSSRRSSRDDEDDDKPKSTRRRSRF